MIWFGSCVGSIASPFFYKSEEAPTYHLGIGSLLVANAIELALFIVLRYAFMWENRRKRERRAELLAQGVIEGSQEELNATAFQNLTDRQNLNFVYVY